MDYTGKTVWIIGASTGIGYALAHELSGRGAQLILSARNGEALAALNHSLGDKHVVRPLDVTDRVAFKLAASEQGMIDSVILLSGTYKPASLKEMDLDAAKNIVDVNIAGALHCIEAVLPVLRQQKKGQLAFCGSVAGYRGLPKAQPYAATKAALISLAETAHIEEKKYGIDVRIINPGFVKTPMTDKNSFPMPMMIAPEGAAKAIADGLLSSAFEIHFPKRFTLLMKFLKCLPDPIYFYLAGKL